MFSAALRTALIALVASAVTVSAGPGLALKLSGADKVDGVDNLKVFTTVTNTGDETLKLLKDPRGPLSKLPTQTFLVTHDESGVSPAFIGAKVKYVPSYAAKFGGSDAFTILPPGQSFVMEHDLSKAYNFTSSGAGKYSFSTSNLFHYADDSGAPVAIYAAQPEAHVASLSGKLVSPRTTLAKRDTYNGCSADEQNQLVAAASAAQNYAASAFANTQAQTGATPRYTTWFGAYTAVRHDIVLAHFTSLHGNVYADYSYDCTCTDSGTYAYVYPDEFGQVYLCGAFWRAPTTGTDSKGGTLIHESTHFTANGGTGDYAYGQSSAKALAKRDPDTAVRNADSHEYYAENNPSLA